MPMLILSIAEDFDELFENRSVTPMTSLSKLGRIMEVTIDLALVFVIRILGSKDCRAY